jgi:hypothetical protein
MSSSAAAAGPSCGRRDRDRAANGRNDCRVPTVPDRCHVYMIGQRRRRCSSPRRSRPLWDPAKKSSGLPKLLVDRAGPVTLGGRHETASSADPYRVHRHERARARRAPPDSTDDRNAESPAGSSERGDKTRISRILTRSASPFGPLSARLRAHETTVARRRPLTTGRCTCWCRASPARTSPGGELASTDALGECEPPGVDDPDGRRANAQTRRAASVPSGLLHGGQRDEDDDAQPQRRYP